jgi:hypothetical protein
MTGDPDHDTEHDAAVAVPERGGAVEQLRTRVVERVLA